MERNDEMTAPGLSQSFHEQKWRGCNESSDGSKLPPSIVRWSGSQTAQKGSSFAKDVCWKTSSFDNVIFTDECSIHMENHGKLSFHRKWEPPKLKGCPKHPFKIHVWAGISKRGSTKIIIFTLLCDQNPCKRPVAVYHGNISRWTQVSARQRSKTHESTLP